MIKKILLYLLFFIIFIILFLLFFKMVYNVDILSSKKYDLNKDGLIVLKHFFTEKENNLNNTRRRTLYL